MVAALLYRNADDFGKKPFYYQTSFRVMDSDNSVLLELQIAQLDRVTPIKIQEQIRLSRQEDSNQDEAPRE